MQPLSQTLLRLTIPALCVIGVADPAASGENFGPPVQISTFVGRENEPSVAGAGDDLIAAWFENNSLGQVGWAFSRDGGKTWTAGSVLPPQSPPDGIIGQPIVACDGAGNFYCALTSIEGLSFNNSLAVYHGMFQGASFIWEQPVYALPLVYQYVPYEAPKLACDTGDGTVYLVCTQDLQLSYEDHQKTVLFTRSLDRGQTWSTSVPLSATTASGAGMVVGRTGEVYVLWEDFATTQVVGRKSLDHGQSFTAPFVAAPVFDNLGAAPPGWLPEFNQFSPVYPGYAGGAPNAPAVAVDRSGGPLDGRLYAVWAERAQGSTAGSGDLTYQAEPNDFYVNATPTQVGNSVGGYEISADISHGDCDIYTFQGVVGTQLWIEGTVAFRSYGYRDVQLLYYLECGDDTLNLMRLGAGVLHERAAMPPFVLTLPSTGTYYLRISCSSASSNQYILGLAVFTPDPASVARDHRDVVLVSSSDGGATWSAKTRVNDDPPGVDDAFPAVAVDDLGQVHVTWYDRRDEPACAARVHTYWTYSDDGGGSFHPSKRISTVASEADYLPLYDYTRGWWVGDHAALQAVGNRVYALWSQVSQPNPAIYGVVIQPDIPTPALVASFTTEPTATGVEVSWSAPHASGPDGFRVERAPAAVGPYTVVTGVLDQGDGRYAVHDRQPIAGSTYFYRLSGLSQTGEILVLAGPLQVTLPGTPRALQWLSAGPNPFRESIRLILASPHAGLGSVAVYDVAGHEMSTLYRGEMAAGTHEFTWDARRSAEPGIYWIRAGIGSESTVRRVVLAR